MLGVIAFVAAVVLGGAAGVAFEHRQMADMKSIVDENSQSIANLRLIVTEMTHAERVSSQEPEVFEWWCHAGASTGFRSPTRCAETHAQGAAGCRGRHVAYCRATTALCFGDRAVCESDQPRPCLGVR